MELFREILSSVLMKEEINIIFPTLKLSAADLIEMESFKALKKIKSIVEDEGLSDFECIERIVCILEDIGSNGGNRHDF